jgi:hypothetical protein
MEFLNQYKSGKSPIGGFIACIFLIVILLMAFSLPLEFAAIQMGIHLDPKSMIADGMNKNLFLGLSLFSFIGMLLAVLISTKAIHKRPLMSLVNTTGKFDYKRFFYAFGLWFALAAIAFIIDYMAHPETYTFQFNGADFFMLCLIALVLIPIQTSAEELLVRSYLMQAVGSLFNQRWVPIVFTSVLFGVLHLANPEVDKFGVWTALPMYIGAGLVFAICTVLDNRLELSLGMHAANNIFLAIFTTNKDSAFYTDALFESPMDDITLNYILWAISCIVFFYFVSKKYQWTSWKYLLQNKN